MDACLRLLKYLSPAEKSLLLKKNDFEGKSNKKKASMMNRKSQEIVKEKSYGVQDIYVRSIIYKK